MAEKEYIDKKALMHDIMRTVIVSTKTGYTNPELTGINKVIDRIKAQPTADVQEVIHGNNKVNKASEMYNGEYFICSECGIILDDILCVLYDEDFEELCTFDFECKYCPSCGAKMDKGD